jgi:WD40 repeat protein
MRWFVLLCLIFLLGTNVQAQTEGHLIPRQVMQLGRGTANAIDWHHAGNILAVGGSLGIWLYDDRLADLAHFPDAGSVRDISWSLNGDQLATADENNTIRLWTVNLDSFVFSLSHDWTFTIDNTYTLRFSWSPEGDRLAVITSFGASVLDVHSGETLLTIPDLKSVISWHSAGTQIAGVVDLGDETGEQVRVWDASTGSTINTYTSPNPHLYWTDVQWSIDGSMLVGITSFPATLHAWRTESGELLNEVNMLTGEFSAYFDMWWLDDGQHLVTISSFVSSQTTSTLEVWDTQTWMPVEQSISLSEPRSISKHPTDETWAVLTFGAQMMLWGLETTEPHQVRAVYSPIPQILAWSSNSQYLAVASSHGETIFVWNVTVPDEPESHIAMVPYQSWTLDELRWGANESTLIGFQSMPVITAPGAFPTAVIVNWCATTGELLGTLHETSGYVAWDGSENYLPSHSWSGDFTRIVTQISGQPLTITTVVSENGLLSPGEEITTADIVGDPFKVVWSHDSTMFAAITRDAQGETSAWVYDAETGDSVNRLTPVFYTNLYEVSWSPDSSLVALAGSRTIDESDETEYRLDILEVVPSLDEASNITTLFNINTPLYHAWHPESRAIAVSHSKGIDIYSTEALSFGTDAFPVVTIPTTDVSNLAWSDDGLWLAGVHVEGTVRVWNVSSTLNGE